MELEITPEPSESERRAILAALAAENDGPAASRWWASGLDELRDDPLSEQPGGDAGVVEP